jgi:hypothetical protein
MRVQVSFSGLFPTVPIGLPNARMPSGTTAAHIHCCLASPFLTDVNVPVATTLPSFPASPWGSRLGPNDSIFDLTLASTYNLGNAALGGTLASAEVVLTAALLAEATYFNIHTNAFSGGEIRGIPGSAGSHRWCRIAGPDLGRRWPSRMVATASADCLSKVS